ncbi:MAG: tyrosine recombinase XerC [Clostridiaceae bacterium]|nr:tyrosine recombinase XerC [Clostridiaceae bacterium]
MKNINDYEIPPVLMDFLSYMQTIRGRSANTVKVYFYDLRVFFRFMKLRRNLADKNTPFEEIPIDDVDIGFIRTITLSDLYAFMAFVSNDRDNSSYARARKVSSLKSFFKYLTFKAKLLDADPAAELESPKLMKRLPRYLNIDESRQLLNSVDGKFSERDYAILTLFLNCGLRLSELVGININNIKGSVLTVVGKGNKERSIPLNQACIKAIEDYLKVRPVDGVRDKNALFLSSRKRRISRETVQKIVKKYIIAAGLDPERYSVHKLRHTAATLMYKYGNVDIRSLQELLGHVSISTTQIYTHLDSSQLRSAVESNPLADFSRSDKK